MAELNARYGTALRALRGRAEVGSYPAHPACLRGNQSGRKDAHVSGLRPSLRLPRAVHSDLQDARVGEDRPGDASCGPARRSSRQRGRPRGRSKRRVGEASVWLVLQGPAASGASSAGSIPARFASRASTRRRTPSSPGTGLRRAAAPSSWDSAWPGSRRTPSDRSGAAAPATDVRSWPSRRLDRLVPIAAFSAANNGVMIGR